MTPIYNFLKHNETMVYLFYGLAFFSMGLAITMRRRSLGSFHVTKSLWALAAFGFIHGLAEWGFVFIPIQEGYFSPAVVSVMRLAHKAQIAVSFAFLLTFGLSLVTGNSPRYRVIRFVSPALLVVWSIAFVYETNLRSRGFILNMEIGEILSRYLLALPGTVLSALGFFLQAREFSGKEFAGVSKSLAGAGMVFGLYAFFSGLIVPPGPFFPASVLNTENFFRFVGLPVMIFRALCGSATAYFMTRVLEVIDIENRRWREEAEKMRAVVEERERIGRELHDGTIQAIYAAGLDLENTLFLLDENPPEAGRQIRKTMGRLDSIVKDIRRYILSLDPAEYQADGVKDWLVETIKTVEVGGGLAIKLSFTGKPAGRISPDHLHEIRQIVQEALSNVQRHARAEQAWITVTFSDGGMILSIRDNGEGFRPAELPGREVSEHGRGLKNIARRAEILGGSVEIKSSRGQGTELILRVPYGG